MSAHDEAAAAIAHVVCAYDGSVNGHWIARYAIRIAAAAPARALRLVHVHDRHASSALLARKLDHIVGECERAGVEAAVHEIRAGGAVAAALLDDLPADARRTLLVCGARARASRRRFLAGTVSEELLGRAPCPVLALRVLVPGLLGAPRNILLPVAGNPGEARDIAPLLARLAPAMSELHLLRVMVERGRTARLHSHEALDRLRGHGRAAVTHFESELRAALDLDAVHLDSYVRVTGDWARATIVVAGQHRCGLIIAGASDRAIAGRLFRRSPLETLLEHAPCDVGIFRP